MKLAAALALILMLNDRANYVLIQVRDGHALRYFLYSLLDLAFQLGIVATMLVLLLAAINLAPAHGIRRYLVLALAVVAAAFLCSFLRMQYLLLNSVKGTFSWTILWNTQLSSFSQRYALLTGMLMAVAEFHRREGQSIEAMHQAELDRITLEQEMAEARLQVLQAQIEPHFLFNTLANVRRLYRTDLVSGNTMLEHLMRYFEVALPRMRENVSSLEREVTLIEAYLSIQQIRMGRRLSFSISVPDELLALRVPSMMLLTLVENAIKHGLNPLLDGGEIRIVARREDALLCISVIDTGAGFGSETAGGGTGLANIHARLAATYGDGGSLALSTNVPRGVQATLVLPIAAATKSGATP